MQGEACEGAKTDDGAARPWIYRPDNIDVLRAASHARQLQGLRDEVLQTCRWVHFGVHSHNFTLASALGKTIWPTRAAPSSEKMGTLEPWRGRAHDDEVQPAAARPYVRCSGRDGCSGCSARSPQRGPLSSSSSSSSPGLLGMIEGRRAGGKAVSTGTGVSVLERDDEGG